MSAWLTLTLLLAWSSQTTGQHHQCHIHGIAEKHALLIYYTHVTRDPVGRYKIKYKIMAWVVNFNSIHD